MLRDKTKYRRRRLCTSVSVQVYERTGITQCVRSIHLLNHFMRR